jgi:hypothetical protein
MSHYRTYPPSIRPAASSVKYPPYQAAKNPYLVSYQALAAPMQNEIQSHYGARARGWHPHPPILICLVAPTFRGG